MKNQLKIYAATVGEWLAGLMILIVNYYSPIGAIFLAVGTFHIADTAVGYYRAAKKKKATSLRLRQGFVSKFIVYFGSLGIMFIADNGLINELTKIFIEIDYLCTKLLGFIFIFIEAKSLNESIISLSGKSIGKHFHELTRSAAFVVKSLNDVKDGKHDEETEFESESEN